MMPSKSHCRAFYLSISKALSGKAITPYSPCFLFNSSGRQGESVGIIIAYANIREGYSIIKFIMEEPDFGTSIVTLVVFVVSDGCGGHGFS
jgi:hypothetical protein